MHRWRNLESSDPQRYEMIRKIQNLQKRIISRNQEIVEKGNQQPAQATPISHHGRAQTTHCLLL